ncbi:replication protein [Sutcliffiella horikoshii]|uniref:replication protein n=1 Tax=Sutcliffiella horikoshii TaxID=79883 RepID=UPI0021CC8E88|nr:replication protein [Sutcliffiella horikoshii]
MQLENGFTRIANDIFEQMAKTKLSPIQYRILFVIWRYTYGFNRKEHEFSLSFIGTATEYDQRQLQRELVKLEQRKIIVQKVKRGKPRIISFNKNHDEWLDNETIGSSTIGNSTKGTIGKVTKGTIGSSTKEERKNLKKNIKKNNKEEEVSILEKIIDLLQISGIVPPRKINRFLREDIEDVIENFGFETPIEVIEEAIKDAARGNGETWKFVYNKLNTWRKSGVKTLADLDHLQENKKVQHKASNVDYDSLAKEFENE